MQYKSLGRYNYNLQLPEPSNQYRIPRILWDEHSNVILYTAFKDV